MQRTVGGILRILYLKPMQYLVEFMKGETVSKSATVEANTPLEAASKLSKRDVVFSVDRADWIRVTPPGRPPLEYGYVKQAK